MTTDQQEDILNRLKANDKSALKELFKTHYVPVCRAIGRLVKDRNMVEDLAQEVFLRFWNKRHTININSSLSAYIRRMATNEALAHLRSKKYFEDEAGLAFKNDASADVEQRFLDGELEDNIKYAINQLPPKCRTVFILSRFEELTYQEIADRMDISIKTVENQMGRALKILRKKLKSYLSLLL